MHAALFPLSAEHPSARSPFASSSRAERAAGEGRISLKLGAEGVTKLDRLYQQGCAKIRLPKVYGANMLEAVLINSSGGLTGGDRLSWDIKAASGTHGVATTQACEKIYKSDEGPAELTTNISVADGARFDWLPQESILFDRARLSRRMCVDLTGSARFLALEAVLLGRLAMGEKVHDISFSDRWIVRRDNRLIHADALSFQGDVTAFGKSAATLSGHQAFANLCYCGPEDSDHLDLLVTQARALAAPYTDCHIGLSAMPGKIILRMTAPDGLQLRAALIPLISLFRSDAPLPRVWTT